YSRMVLPYWIANRIPRQHVFTGDDAYFNTLKIDRHIGHRATAVDPKSKQVTLQDGRKLDFDNLLLATGSSATLPPVPGIDLSGVQPLWTLAHTDAVLQAAGTNPPPQSLLLRAGLLRLLVAHPHFKAGWEPHV